MKIIFLDIDGVLVTRRLGVFEDNLLASLKRVVDETGAVIVLSSDWRRHPAARLEAKRVLGTVGLSFISYTPIMSAHIAQRPTEIMQWKKDFKQRSDSDRVTNWVAIDDRALLEERHGSYLRGHFVQTAPIRGLTEMAADECISILNQEPPAAPAPPEERRTSEMARGFQRSEALDALGGSMPAGGVRGPLGIGNPSGAKRSGVPPRSLAGLGAGHYSLGNDSLPSRAPEPAGLPSVGRPRGRSVPAPGSSHMSRSHR